MRDSFPFRPPYVLLVLLREVAEREHRTMNDILTDAVKHYLGITVEGDPDTPPKILQHLHELLEMDKSTIEKRLDALEKVKGEALQREQARAEGETLKDAAFRKVYPDPQRIAKRRFGSKEDYSNDFKEEAARISKILGIEVTPEQAEEWVWRHAASEQAPEVSP